MDDLAALAAFTAARLDEDEAAARKLADMLASAPGADLAVCFDDGTSGTAFDYNPWDRVADYDPARVLREVAAKRARLERYVSAVRAAEKWRTEGGSQTVEIILITLCKEVQHDAAVWSDHPDYRQEWKP